MRKLSLYGLLISSFLNLFFTGSIYADLEVGGVEVSLNPDTFKIFSLFFVLFTVLILIIGGNLKKKNISLKTWAVILKVLSFFPLLLIVFILAERGGGFFSFWETISGLASLLLSVFLFGMADFLQEKN